MTETRRTTWQLRRAKARGTVAGVVLLLALGLCGCASSAYLAMASEDDQLPYAQLKSAWVARPITTTLIPTRIGDGPLVNIAIHETGRASTDRVIVFIHGVFTDHSAWRFVTGVLGEDHDLILVDLPGCGDSDRPDPRRLGPNGYSPDAMAERLWQVLEIHLAHRRRQPQITLVGHSLGGMIALRMMGSTDLRQRHEQIARSVDRMVLMAPADVEIINPPALFVQIAELSGPEVMFGDVTGILMQRICEGTRSSVDDPAKALREEARTRHEMLTQRSTRRALQAVFTQAVPMRDDRPDWPVIERLVGDYANVRVPCLIVWGAHDETLPVSMGYKLAAQLPLAQLHVVPDCMHSVHLERPILCANLIRDFGVPDPSRASDMLSSQPTLAEAAGRLLR